MNVTVIGTGYVGLVTGACLADAGNYVICIDLDAEKVRRLNLGRIPIYEPGLEPIVRRNRETGRLLFSTDVAKSVAHGDIQFITVGTPPREDGAADMKHVLAAAHAIGRHMNRYTVVATKSTAPVGTAKNVRNAIAHELARRKKMTVMYSVVSNPEFLKEGAAVGDFMSPDRIVVGSDEKRATGLLRKLYAPFQRNRDRFMVMSVRAAELTKYAANAMLATRISFMNELANLAESLGVDIEEVRRGIGSDPRIGHDFLYAGAGFGGSCFPKDVKALVRLAVEVGRPLRVLEAVGSANDAQKHVLGDKIQAQFKHKIEGKCFAVWGLAFKPNTDDMREASSLTLINDLIGAGATVRAYDPVAGPQAAKIFAREKRVKIAKTAISALKGCEALAIVTEWQEFRAPDFKRVKALLKTPAIFDGRNLYDPETMRTLGFEYFPIGRKP